MGYLLVMAIMVIAIVAVVLWLRADLDQEARDQDRDTEVAHPSIEVGEASRLAPGTLPVTAENDDDGGTNDGRSRTGIPEETA